MKNNKGFIGMGLILAIIAVLVVGGGAYYLRTKNSSVSKDIKENLPVENQTQNNQLEENQIEKGQYKFAYYQYQDNKLYISSTDGEVTFLGSDVKIKKDKIESPRYYSYSVMSKNVLENIKLSPDMGFYSAIQSIDDEDLWIFTERYTQNAPDGELSSKYNLYFYNNKTKTREFIFSQDKNPDPKYSFIPFAWTKDIVYLEAKVFGSATENEGIWSYDIKTKQFSKLPISSSYVTTPIISPDGKYFIYGGTTGHKDLDSSLNIIFVYDITKNQEKIVVKDNNFSFWASGWINGGINTSDLININEDES